MITFLFLQSFQKPVKCVNIHHEQYFSQYIDGHNCYSLDERYAQRTNDSRGFECIYPHVIGNYNKNTDDTPCIECSPGYRRLQNDECEYQPNIRQKLDELTNFDINRASPTVETCNITGSTSNCSGGQVCIPTQSGGTTGTCFACDSFSTQNTIVNNNCKCKQGYAAVQITSPVQVCYQCPKGTYTSGDDGRPICKSCGSGKTTATAGSFTDASCYQEIDQWIIVGITVGIFVVIVVVTIIILYIYVKRATRKQGPPKKRVVKLKSQEKPDLLSMHSGSINASQNQSNVGLVPSVQAPAEVEPRTK